PSDLIDLTHIGELTEIREEAEGIRVGAAVTLQQLADYETVRQSYRAVSEAAGSVAGPTHRAYGTVGGNLCLDTRCLFYNQSEWWRSSNAYCLKHRGDVCHVAPGGRECFAAYSGDLAPAMLVHEARAGLIGPDGRREIPLADLYRDDGMDHLTMAPGELLASVLLPKETADIPSGYEKSRVRGAIDFPLAGAAARLRTRDGVIEDIHVALTGVRSWPFALTGTDRFVGEVLDDGVLDDLREMARTQSKPMRTGTVAPWYRRRVVGALTRRLAARLGA
ncbi:MAG: FAD binding domain-containing protein, partial [Proteobacteria bacterium]|nr:FAD binding domain-containing protein [Pseudomonadota bacterium]